MNKELLIEFTDFCETHPELSFWRSLVAWVQEKHDKHFTQLLFKKDGKMYDTVNWTGVDDAMVLFKNEIK